MNFIILHDNKKFSYFLLIWIRQVRVIPVTDPINNPMIKLIIIDIVDLLLILYLRLRILLSFSKVYPELLKIFFFRLIINHSRNDSCRLVVCFFYLIFLIDKNNSGIIRGEFKRDAADIQL